MTIDEAWAKNTTRRKKPGYWEISCNKGNWEVVGSDLEEVTDEAMHYFQQYYSDGYYDGDPNDRFIKELVKARRESK